MASEQWGNAETCRDLVEDKEWLKQLAFPKPEKPAEGEDEEPKGEQDYTVEVSGRRFDVKVIGPPPVAGAAGAGGDGAGAPPQRPGGRGRGGGGGRRGAPGAP